MESESEPYPYFDLGSSLKQNR